MRFPPAVLLSLLLTAGGPAAAAPVAAAAPSATVESAHYRVTVEGTEAEADEVAKVLEAAWPLYRDFFGAEPKLAEGERLGVFVAATVEGFRARLTADGITPPAAGGYYSPGNRTAYLWRQPTIYYSRCLLLHEAAHQFHYLARTGNRALPMGWYVEGIAEYLCRHTWDGERLAVGVLPTLSLEDYAAAARREAAGDAGALASRLAKGDLSRPLMWALFRWLRHGAEEKKRANLPRLCDKLDRGAAGDDLLWKAFGSPPRVAEALVAYLETEQEPWTPVFNEWEGIGPGRIRGVAPPPIVSFCRVKAEVRRLAASLQVPAEGDWRGGLLLDYAGNADYVVAMSTPDGTVTVARRTDAAGWQTLGAVKFPPPAPGQPLPFVAERGEGGVRLRVAGRDAGHYPLAARSMGLALQGCDLRFADVAWE